jgi:hypothetical protein
MMKGVVIVDFGIEVWNHVVTVSSFPSSFNGI